MNDENLTQDWKYQAAEWKSIAMDWKKQYLDLAKDENPWISVDDEMKPKRGERVRIFTTRPEESHDHWLGDHWDGNFDDNVTHWQRIVGPKKPTSPTMVEAPREENMYISDQDPSNMKIGCCYLEEDGKIYWWNNKKHHRLWYWHNDQWNRAI